MSFDIVAGNFGVYLIDSSALTNQIYRVWPPRQCQPAAQQADGFLSENY
jgi:hypothetical protein